MTKHGIRLSYQTDYHTFQTLGWKEFDFDNQSKETIKGSINDFFDSLKRNKIIQDGQLVVDFVVDNTQS